MQISRQGRERLQRPLILQLLPGHSLTDGKTRIALAQQLGNLILMQPYPNAGTGT